MLVHEDAEYIDPFFNEGERTLKEIQDLKIKITEIFVKYPGLNVLLEDALGTVIFDVLENIQIRLAILSRMLTTNQWVNIKTLVLVWMEEGDEDDEDEHEEPQKLSELVLLVGVRI